jgi:predicted enzyme related to lactoylglutathione lyase
MANTQVGDFVWYELMTLDAKAAIDFYAHVLGWTASPFGDDYTMFANAEGPLAGVSVLPEEAKQMGTRPHWVSHVQVANVDATVAEATKLGGRLYFGPADIPDIGRFAAIGDPDGAPIHVFTPTRAMDTRDRRRHGAFVWHELLAVAHERAFAFHSQLFGWKKVRDHAMGPMGNYLIYGNGGSDLGGMFTKPKEVPATMWMHYIQVDDLGAALARATARGAKVLSGPMEVPGGAHIVQLADPQGAAISLHEEPKRQSA